MKGQTLIIFLVFLVLGLFLLKRTSSAGKQPAEVGEVGVGAPPEGGADSDSFTQPTSKSGFLPSKQGPWFQNLPPLTTMENDYHKYVHNDCNGDYAKLECRQKAYTKAVKAGTTDIKDLMCWRFRPEAQGGSDDLYYKCMDSAYGDYHWMDRFTGTAPCLCENGEFPGQGQGAGMASDPEGCYCPKHRPLVQRWPLNQYGEPVDRITQGNYL